MAQFDVYPNPSPRQREAVPYMVVMQSDLLDHLPTRLVMPLVTREYNSAPLPPRLSPAFRIEGRTLHLWPQQAATIPSRLLGQPVTTLRSEQARLVDALDAVVSGV